MKKQIAFVTALTLGLILIAIPVSATYFGQTSSNDEPPLWSSSAPIPEGTQVVSPPDAPTTIDAVDMSTAQTYNASMRIAGSVVKPRESSVDWTGSGGGGCIYASAGSTYAVFNTPVYLPQGSIIKYMRMYYNDANTSLNSSAWFTVYDLYGSIVNEYGVNSSGSTGNGYATTEEFTHTVNYDNYAYVVNWRPNDLGSDMQVCGFRIYYHTPPGVIYLPLVMKN